MKPSEECKMAGLKGMLELTELSGVSKETLTNWHKKSKFLFDNALAKAIAKKHDMQFIKQGD
jgi:hypothetical protein